MDIYVVNLTTTASGRIEMSFYATLFKRTLSADSLETFLRKDTTLQPTLSQNGVLLVEVSRPDEVATAPQSQNSVVVILGVLLGAAGAVILIACIVIAG